MASPASIMTWNSRCLDFCMTCAVFLCTSCRVTISVHQPTCPSVNRSAVAVLLYRWSTLPTWWISGKMLPVSSLSIHLTPNTAGPRTMSSSLPTQLAWQVRQMRERQMHYLESVFNIFIYSICMHKHDLPLFSLCQMCRCMCATKKATVISQCRCVPTLPCKMRRTASCILSLRSWVSVMSLFTGIKLIHLLLLQLFLVVSCTCLHT